jgi:hypothetical protein
MSLESSPTISTLSVTASNWYVSFVMGGTGGANVRTRLISKDMVFEMATESRSPGRGTTNRSE